MGRFAIASAALALTGCELVFPLEPAARDADPGAGDASGDASGDGGAGPPDADGCGMSDEDGDGIRDLCDPCPTSEPTGENLDNDALDSGCDPRPLEDDQIVAFFGFNQPLAADGWSVVYGSAADVDVEGGSLRIQTLSDVAIALPGTMPAAYTVEVGAAVATPQSSKLAVFHDVNVGPQNLGNGRWCFLFQNGGANALMGWELLADGEATDTAINQVPTPAPFARFRLGAFRDLGGTIGCVWDGVRAVPADVVVFDHHGPALYGQVGEFYVDWLVVYAPL
jgi:hypothetical protein